MSTMNINQALRIASRTGKIYLGTSSGMKNISFGRVKVAVLASNSPSEIRQKVEVRCKETQTPLIIYPGSGYDLGSAVGKPFMVNLLTVEKEGDSNIMGFVEGENHDEDQTED
jgi:large subunit ribosomal protein L30e